MSRALTITVRQAFDEYVEYLEEQKKTARVARLQLAKHFSVLHDRPVSALTLTEISRAFWAIPKSIVGTNPDAERLRAAKASANRVLSSLKAALTRARKHHRKEIPTDLEWHDVQFFDVADGQRETILTRDQVKALLVAIRNPFLKRLAKAAYLTGARPPGEFAEMMAKDYRGNSELYIRDGKEGPRTMILSPAADQLFAELVAGKALTELLFPRNAKGEKWNKLGYHCRAFKKAVVAAGLPAEASLYCLRHTYITEMINSGESVTFIAKNVGNSAAMIEQHYEHLTHKMRLARAAHSPVNLD